MLNNFLKTALTNNHYAFSVAIEQQFIQFLELLQKWNRVFNLTAITEPNEMVLLHILDSLSVNPFLNGTRIMDVGTGAGLPGIPLALVNPDKEFFLLDSNSKKTRFLTQAVAELNLNNVQVVHTRCEDFKVDLGFDTILSRAFASLHVMLASTRHLLATQGRFLAMKGVHPAEELADIPNDFTHIIVHPINIVGLQAKRCVVEIEY